MKSIIKALVKRLPIGIRFFYGLPISSSEKRYVVNELVSKHRNSKSNPEKRILIWGAGGMPAMARIEAIIATSLRLRGVDVKVVICDGVLQGCIRREIKEQIPYKEWPSKCDECMTAMNSMYESFGLTVNKFSEYLNKDIVDRISKEVKLVNSENIFKYTYRGVDVGQYACSSAIRYSKDVTLQGCEDIIRHYFYSAMISAEVANNILTDYLPDKVFMSHGIYVDWGPALDLACANNIQVINWGAGYRHDHVYLKTVTNNNERKRPVLSDNTWAEIEKEDFTPEKEARLNNYLNLRYKKGFFDNTRFRKKLPKIEDNQDLVYETLGVSGERPIWCVFSHINWDAVFNASKMPFDNVNAWIDYTIDVISKITDVDWLIKIHPNEPGWATGKGVGDYISKKHQNLPPHIHVISPGVNINNSVLFPKLAGGVTLHGTSGLELAIMGKPVILAANAHYSKKGFTYDAEDINQYEHYLSSVLKLGPLKKEEIELTQKYAYSYFIERQLPLSSIVKSDSKRLWKFDYRDCIKLIPGKDEMIDYLCDQIIAGGDFIMSKELVNLLDEKGI